MKKAVLLLLVAIIMVLAIGCQKSKSDDISNLTFSKARQVVITTEKLLDGKIDYDEAKEKIDKIAEEYFLYGNPHKGDDSTVFTLLMNYVVTINTSLRHEDYSDKDVKDIKEAISNIEEEIYQ